ncbi:MAG: nitrite/sulfite reductase [Candidatus Bathyarchaeia archaeon]
MPIFNPKDKPRDVEQKVIDHASVGYDEFVRKQGTLALDKLRMVGVYDDRQEGYFMLRTRIPGGYLTTTQARVVGEVAEEFCARPKGYTEPYEQFLEITTRQDIQLHWVRVEDLPEIWRRYDAVGLTSLQACGNSARNITSCPAAGVDPEELIDTRKLVADATKFVIDNPAYGAFLPRKFKTAIIGARENCALAQINDLSFTPAESDGEVGFNVWVGGGLSDYPRLASSLDLFIPPSLLIEAMKACIQVYKDLGDYKHAAANRFRLLVHQLGVPRIRTEMRKRASFEFKPAGKELMDRVGNDHVGVHEQKQSGFVYVGLNVPIGRMQGKELVELAKVAEEYGSQDLRLSQRQNLIIAGIRAGEAGDLLRHPLLKKFSPQPPPFSRALVACTGAPFCKFGICSSKDTALALMDHLDKTVHERWGWTAPPVTIHISACKASCAQPQIADIGLRGNVDVAEKGFEEAFDVSFGGDLLSWKLNEWVETPVPVSKLYSGLEQLFTQYLNMRKPDEAFREFWKRRGMEEFKKTIRGETVGKEE